MTRIKDLVRYMNELEAGFDRTLQPLPTETVFLKSGGWSSGRFGTVQIEPYEEDEFTHLESRPGIWFPTEEPSPSRWYPARTKGHSRGTVVNPKTRQAITFASTYEKNLALMLCASRHVATVEDQPSAIPVECADGVRRHTIDYRAVMETGTKVVVAVRPSWLLEKGDLRGTVAGIKAGIENGSLEGFADDAIILTEREVTANRGWNAELTLRALKYRNAEHNVAVAEYAARFHGSMHINSLNAAIDAPAAEAMNAVWCLLYDGLLQMVRPDLKLLDCPYVKFAHLN